jgi:hypothetical protein
MPLEVVSYSSLKQWSECPRSGFLGQHLGLRKFEEPRTGAMPFGGRIHTALELFGRSGWVISSARIWQKLMDREFEIAEESGWPNDLDKESAMGQVMLEGFEDWLEAQGIFSAWTVVGIEKKLSTTITIRLANGSEIDVLMRGKLDLLTQRNSDGALFVEDYKTTSSLTDDSIMAMQSESQGPIYTMLARRENPEQWVAGFILTMLRKVKRGPTSRPPYYQREVLPYSDAKLDAAMQNVTAQVQRVADIVEKIENGADHRDVAPYKPSWQCKTCPFRLPCYEMQEGNFDGAERMLLDLYVTDDPLRRYSQDDSLTLEALGFKTV